MSIFGTRTITTAKSTVEQRPLPPNAIGPRREEPPARQQVAQNMMTKAEMMVAFAFSHDRFGRSVGRFGKAGMEGRGWDRLSGTDRQMMERKDPV